MESSLSNLVDNLVEGIQKIKCKDNDCFLEYKSVKDKTITLNVEQKWWTFKKAVQEHI